MFYEFVVGTSPFESYLAASARAAAVLLLVAGESVTAQGDTLSGRFAMSLAVGCDGLQPMAILASGVLAFPARRSRKVIGILLGCLALFGLNVLRIASLYWLGARGSGYFQTAHVHLWPGLLILVALLLWLVWARGALRTTPLPVLATP